MTWLPVREHQNILCYKLWAFLWSLILSMWGGHLTEQGICFCIVHWFCKEELQQLKNNLGRHRRSGPFSPQAKGLGREVRNWRFCTDTWNSSHHHLHPYQPGQMFPCNILSQHTEVKDTGRLWESNFISKCYKYLTMPIKANELSFGIVWNEHQCSAPEKYYLT